MLHYAADDDCKVALFGFVTTLNNYTLLLNNSPWMMVKITQKIYWSLLASTFATAAVADYPVYDTELSRLSAGLWLKHNKMI
ncbi:MAG: hypothetical protein Q8N30_04535 [Methylococcales bacterium]|nr:hypothetical protein [Methylococcales bacterium]